MENKTFTVVDTLRFANHDFLNHLQLINLNLELGRIEEAKGLIRDISENYKSYSILKMIPLPKTVEWLYTFNFRYPAIHLTINSSVEDVNRLQNDDEIVEYLDNTIKHVYNGLDPFLEHKLLIDIQIKQNNFKLQFQLTGKWETELAHPTKLTNIKVKTYEKTNQSWKYELTSE